jgi:hypothetical protein
MLSRVKASRAVLEVKKEIPDNLTVEGEYVMKMRSTQGGDR